VDHQKEAAFEMVLIRLNKEPSTEDANASKLAANGGGGPVQSINHTSSNEDEGELDKDSQTRERGHNTGRGRGRGQGRGYNKRNFRQNKNSHASTVKRNDDEEVGFIFKVSGIETFTHQTSRTKLSNIKAPESLTVDALAPLNHSVEALVLRYVNINTPVSLSVDALAPPYQNVEALAPSYRRVEVLCSRSFKCRRLSSTVTQC